MSACRPSIGSIPTLRGFNSSHPDTLSNTLEATKRTPPFELFLRFRPGQGVLRSTSDLASESLLRCFPSFDLKHNSAYPLSFMYRKINSHVPSSPVFSLQQIRVWQLSLSPYSDPSRRHLRDLQWLAIRGKRRVSWV